MVWLTWYGTADIARSLADMAHGVANMACSVADTVRMRPTWYIVHGAATLTAIFENFSKHFFSKSTQMSNNGQLSKKTENIFITF